MAAHGTGETWQVVDVVVGAPHHFRGRDAQIATRTLGAEPPALTASPRTTMQSLFYMRNCVLFHANGHRHKMDGCYNDVPDILDLSINLSISHNPIDKEYAVKNESKLDATDFMMVDNIKITPSNLHFVNTVEGEIFERTIEIQNCGSKTAIVRLELPSNSVFQIKAFPLGLRISSGMKIIRKLMYSHQQHCAIVQYCLPIFINDHLVPYKLTVSPSVAKISIDQTILDFGMMDVGYNVTRRSFKITNSGSKPALFSIDLPANEFQLSVNPYKGVIKPDSEIMVYVEIGSLEEGLIQADIFVKCIDIFKVAIRGNVVVGRLEVCNIPSCQYFTMVEFPMTYYGAKSTQHLVLRNNSATRTVFCVVYCEGSRDGEPFTQNPYFTITPLDGRLEPREARIFTIDYEPRLKSNDDRFHFATLIIKKLNYCKDMNVTDYPSGLYNTLRNFKSVEHKKQLSSFSSIKSPSSSSHRGSFVDSYVKNWSSENLDPQFDYKYDQEIVTDSSLVELESIIKVCLHGEPKKVHVSCTPDLIILENMLINQPVDRVVILKNKSVHLPIKFIYDKVAFIDVRPKTGTLQPLTSMELKIVLTSCKFGRVNTQIRWLLYNPNSKIDEDMLINVGKVNVKVTMEAKVITTTPGFSINLGITPKYIRETGKYYDNVKYNTEGTIPKLIMGPLKRKERKNDKAIIAFPNDRPETLRVMWNKNKQIETIYAKMPRVMPSTDDFYMKKEEQYLRALVKDFYSKYLKQNRLEQLKILHKNELPEYELTKLKQFLIFRYFVEDNDEFRTKITHSFVDGFIPLSPQQLNRIKIVPMHLTTGIIAAYSKISSSFNIINNNDMYIRIYVIPEKQRFTFPDGEGVTIHPHSTKTINFTYFSEYEGFHILLFRIVVNETHIFEITMMSHVVSRKVYIYPQKTIFGPNDPSIKFINFYNPLNVSIDFAWDRTDSNFIIEPLFGKIPPFKDMACMITYDPLRNMTDNLDLRYSTQLNHKYTHNVSAVFPVINTILCDGTMDFGSVGCNLLQCKQAVLWNYSNCAVQFSVGNPIPMSGLQILPKSGTIPKRTCQLLSIQLQSIECIAFDHIVDVFINDKAKHQLKIQGQVIFPNIQFTPNPIKLKKMPGTSFQKYSVTLKNNSRATTHLSFNFQNLTEHTIRETENGDRFEQAEFILEPNQSKLFFLQMDPTNVTSMWYLIPFVINHILGPPIGKTALAAKTKTYIPFTEHKLPDTFPLLEIFATVIQSDFSLSKLDFRFVYHPYNTSENYCSENTVFKNISEKTLTFCLKLNNLIKPFQIEFESGPPVIPHALSVTFILEPGESMTFCITYIPNEHSGHRHHNDIPFYIQNDYIEDMHNYLRLSGTCVLPKIIATPSIIYLEYLPLKFRFNKSVHVIAKNHLDQCQINAESPNGNLKVIIDYMRRDLVKKRHDIDMTIIYASQYVEAFKATINLFCNCGGATDILCVGVAENSIFTTFRVAKNVKKRIYFPQQGLSKTSIQQSETFRPFAEDLISFPYFPEDTEDDFVYMTEVLEAIESYLFCQGFCGKYHYSIPESFSMLMPVPRAKIFVGLKSNLFDSNYIVPYVELLKLIASNDIANKFNWQIRATSMKDKSKQLHCLYKNVLDYLTDLNCHFPHVEPELLLNYQDYKIYMTSINVDRTKLTVTETHHNYYNFILLSKQAWLDVLLQTLKIFIFGRIKIPKDPKMSLLLNTDLCESKDGEEPFILVSEFNSVLKHSVADRSVEFYKLIEGHQEYNSSDPTRHHIYSNTECFLLNWISFCFGKSFGSICKRRTKEILKEKLVDDFDSCFMDSLLLATAILTYCPYLKNYFSNLYWVPIGTEQFHHNAAIVVQALAFIKCSFELKPCNIYNPINVQMALFVAYLYEFLPSIYPHTTITVKANLSKTSIVKITINNDNNFEVTYAVSFFQNDHRSFSETRSTLTIKPKHREILTVKYTAKFCTKVKAIMMLCGETLSGRCAQSIVYNLIGEPDVTYITAYYTIHTRLYSSQEHILDLVSPYKGPACYDIFFRLDPPISYDNLFMVNYNDILKQKLPCCFNYDNSQIIFNSQSKASITFTGIALSMFTRKVWLILRNAEVGDFLIYIEMATAPTKDVEILYACISSEIYNMRCLCHDKGKNFCKKYVKVKIPKTNHSLLEVFRNMFVRIKGNDGGFWAVYIKRTSAVRHIRKLLIDAHNYDMLLYLDLLVKDKTYNVRMVNGRSDITCPPTVDIGNMEADYCKDEYVTLAFHVESTPINSLIVELWNSDHNELRRYKIIFNNVAKH